MNYTTLQARVALIAGNMATTHPQYGNLGQFVNDGMHFLVQRSSLKFPNYELFPEHKDIEWTDLTIADQRYLALPTDQIAIQRVFSLDSSSAPNLNNSNWRPVSYIEPQAFDVLPKTTTITGYPSLFTLREGRVEFNPTPRTSWTTYVKIDGIQDEPTLSSGTDSPRSHARWHPAMVNCAAYLLLTDMGWHEDAQKQLNAADEQIGTIGGSMIGLRKAQIRRTVRVAGTPRGVW